MSELIETCFEIREMFRMLYASLNEHLVIRLLLWCHHIVLLRGLQTVIVNISLKKLIKCYS